MQKKESRENYIEINLNNEEKLLSEEESISSNTEEKDNFDVDLDRLTLIQVKQIINKKRYSKQKKETISLLNKKRINYDNAIIYDAKNNKIKNTFCPSYEDLKDFFENCTVKVIDLTEYEEEKLNNEDIETFDPIGFMKKYNKHKSYLSVEDLYEEIIVIEEKEEKEEMISLITPKIINSNTFTLNESYINLKEIEKENDSTTKFKNILYTDSMLDTYQKDWLNNYIRKISKMSINDIIKKGKKLQIILDLDNTCIFSFINSQIKGEASKYISLYPEKNINILSFNLLKKRMYSSIIIRPGLKEFIEYVSPFCEFNVRTFGRKPYANKICELLEEKYGIKFKEIIARDAENNQCTLIKSLDEFQDTNINANNSIIIDDSITVWEKDLYNVILSKKFFDKECGIKYLETKCDTDNNFTTILKSHGKFYYYSFSKEYDFKNNKKDEKISWKTQRIQKSLACPFYEYKQKDEKFFFDIYNGEYFNSTKKQFIYMKNVIKMLYYLNYYDKVPIYDAIKLIRLNIFYNKYFFLKYLTINQKIILSDIINICGGKVIEPNESIKYKMKKIFLVTSLDFYEKERKNIINEINNNNNYILVSEKYVLDCYYLMTDLDADYLSDEYNPESRLKKMNTYFK